MAKDEKETKGNGEKSFEVSRFQPADAEGITRLFLAVYGKHYPIQLFYDPQAIVKVNEEGSYYSIVARSMSGEVIGVEHLFRSAPYPSLYEAGVGMVHSDYRSLGANIEMLGYLYEDFVPSMKNIEEVFGEAVCNHLIMQKTVERFKHIETGIEVALMPAAAYDKEKSAPGRVATLSVFRCYRPKPHRIFLPAAYEKELRAIYARLDDRRDINLSDAKVPENLKSQADLTVFDFAQVARISVPEVGTDFVEYFSNIEKDAISRKAEVLQVWLDLTKPWVGEAVEELRKMGYFFGGALPRWFDGDGILMQKLLCPPYFESIHLLSDFSKQLLEVIRKDWQRAGMK
jgi:hypothetical protein